MKKIQKSFNLIAAILMLAIIVVSCGSDDLTEIQNENNNTEADANRMILDLNWDVYQNGPYSENDATKDFRSLSHWNNRVSIEDKALQVKLLADKLSGSGGIVSRATIPTSNEYRLSFDVRFADDFVWSRGGKIGFGLLMGDGNTGCDKADDGNGASARIMWYTSNNGETKFKPYLYYNDMPDTCGDSLISDAAYPDTGSLEKGKWYTIEIYVKSNTGDNKDGHVTYKVNNTIVLDEAIRWATNDDKQLINSLTFSTFRGGSEDHWKADVDSNLQLDNLKLEKLGSGSVASNSESELFPEASQTNIEEGNSVVFSDYSTRVKSRQWTFEGGSVSTSDANRVSVTYDEAGEYAATLTVTFEDGSIKSETIMITVTGEYVPLVSVEGPTFVFYSEDPDLVQDYPSFSLRKSGAGLVSFVATAFEGKEAINLSADPASGSTFAMLQIQGEGSFDLTQFRNGYINLAVKSTNLDPINVRIEGGGAMSYAYAAPGDYGFERDGNWHFISIPMEDLLSQIDSEDGKMSLLANFDQFRYRNNQSGSLNKATFDHSLDFIFFSQELPTLNY